MRPTSTLCVCVYENKCGWISLKNCIHFIFITSKNWFICEWFVCDMAYRQHSPCLLQPHTNKRASERTNSLKKKMSILCMHMFVNESPTNPTHLTEFVENWNEIKSNEKVAHLHRISWNNMSKLDSEFSIRESNTFYKQSKVSHSNGWIW